MHRLTKIVATIGPACESPQMIGRMIRAGVNVFRFNFKHNSVEWHNEMISRVNEVADSMGVRIGTLIDLQGPEIRINIPEAELPIVEGEMILLGDEVLKGEVKGITISHSEIISHLKNGQKVLIDDGAFEFKVVKEGQRTYLLSKTTGTLKHRKGMNIPGAEFPLPVLIDRDLDGLNLAKKQEVDFVALSFVRDASDIAVLREAMKKHQVKAAIVSKIETQMALNNLESIVTTSDGIMVARGDMGVELPIEQVPYFQKRIIKLCIENAKFVITATQMLQSMIEAPMPTRAEVSDVANASYDLTDATMLSGESASGKYPIESVVMMDRTLSFNERKFFSDNRGKFSINWSELEGLICNAAYDVYLKMLALKRPVAGFLVFTHTGKTVRMLSSFRPHVPIYAFCPTDHVADLLTIQHAVIPLVAYGEYSKNMRMTPEHILKAGNYLKEQGLARPLDTFIVLYGDYWATGGGTSTLKLMTVPQ